jgi:mRNA interferase MazF
LVTRPPNPRRGEIGLANLDPTTGAEIQKTRPCVVISPPAINDYLRTLTVAPMTTGSRAAPFRIAITFRNKTGLILLDQLRTLDKQRLVRRLGAIGDTRLGFNLATLREMFEE